MLSRILVGDNERVLLIRRKRFADILGPGAYRIFNLGVEIERYEIHPLVFESQWAGFIVREKPEIAARYFTVIETKDTQLAIVYLDGALSKVIAPGQRALYWCGPVEVTFDLIELQKDPEVPARMLQTPARKLRAESQKAYKLVHG